MIGNTSLSNLFHQPFNLAYPKNHRSAQNDAQPVAERKRNDIEHLATEVDNQNLTDKDDQQGEIEATTQFLLGQTLKSRAIRTIRLGIEDVPKLHENENRKQQRKLFGREITSHTTEIEIIGEIIVEGEVGQGLHTAVLEVLDESKQDRDKKQPHSKDALAHVFRDDEGLA